MRKAALVVISFMFCLAVSAQRMVQFKTSKPYNVLNFVETAAKKGFYSSTYKKYIDSAISKNDQAFQKLITDFVELDLDYHYKLEQLPVTRQQYRSTYELLVIAAVQSNSLPEFRNRAMGIFPNEDFEKLFNILQQAEKYYDQIIWRTNKPKVEKQMQALAKYQLQVDTLFQRYKNFYRSSWSGNIPFTVALYPMPGYKGSSTATPHANSLCVGVFADETQHVERLGVVVHEMCHVLYNEQKSTVQHQLDSLFINNKSPYSKLAYSFIDEALATALGNGWAYQYLAKRMDTTAWYNNPYINGFAHALYPMVNQYLTSNKAIDADFINAAIRLFGETFPKSTVDYKILLNNMFVYADFESSAERNTFRTTLNKYFQSSRSNLSTPILHEYSIESLKTAKETQLIIIDKNHDKTIAGLKELFPAMTDHLKGNTPANYILSFFDQNQRPVVIINLSEAKYLDRAFATIAAQRYIDENNKLVPVQ